MQAQSGRFRGLDWSISKVLCCFLVNGVKCLKIVLDGGGGGGLGGGGGGRLALEALFVSVGAPLSLACKILSLTFDLN